MRTFRPLRGILAAVALAAVAAAPSLAEEILAVTNDNTLITFDSDSPQSVDSFRTITLLDGNVVAIDVRPADGLLYALTDTGRLFRIDRASGVASPVGNAPISPGINGHAGMNFDPVTDRIRVVTDTDENLRVNPNDGTVEDADPSILGIQIDAPLAYVPSDRNASTNPAVVAAAHTSDFPNGRTTCFVIDVNLDVLAILGDADGFPASRDAGRLHTVGVLGLNATSPVGFDISLVTGRAFAVLRNPSDPLPKLYAISLFTGAATAIGPIGDPRPLVTIAVGPASSVPASPRIEMIGLTLGGELVRFESDDPSTITNRLAVTGLVPGDSLVAIALRPSNRRLYGISNGGRLYVLNALTGVARAVRTTPFEVPLAGSQFSFDFNPVTDVARIVSNTGQNMRIEPDTGAVVDSDPRTPGVQPDTALRFADNDPHVGPAPTVVAAAFDRDNPGALSTTMFGIDSNFDVLVKQGSLGGAPSPNGGILHTVGALGVDATSVLGFEIFGDSTAIAALPSPGGASNLYSIDLATGGATFIGSIGVSEMIQSLATAPTSNPPTFGDALRVASMIVRLDFQDAGRDSVTIVGSLPFPDDGRRGRHVTVDVGGFTKDFVLGRHGIGRDDAGTRKAADDDSFQLVGRPVDGRVGFAFRLRRDDVAAALADEGLVDADVRHATPTVRVSITVDGVETATDVTLRYTAHAGKSGVGHEP